MGVEGGVGEEGEGEGGAEGVEVEAAGGAVVGEAGAGAGAGVAVEGALRVGGDREEGEGVGLVGGVVDEGGHLGALDVEDVAAWAACVAVAASGREPAVGARCWRR